MTQAEKGDAENGKEKGGEKEKEQRGVKRPIVPALVPESLQEQIQSNFIVVIHPGSTTLRIGRATDTLPASILMSLHEDTNNKGSHYTRTTGS